MVRIFTADESKAITITVDGPLVNDCVKAVDTCIREAMDGGRPVHLYLRDVSHIDDHARALLSRLAAKGVQLTASGVYSSYIVDEITRKQRKRSGDSEGVDASKRKC